MAYDFEEEFEEVIYNHDKQKKLYRKHRKKMPHDKAYRIIRSYGWFADKTTRKRNKRWLHKVNRKKLDLKNSDYHKHTSYSWCAVAWQY